MKHSNKELPSNKKEKKRKQDYFINYENLARVGIKLSCYIGQNIKNKDSCLNEASRANRRREQIFQINDIVSRNSNGITALNKKKYNECISYSFGLVDELYDIFSVTNPEVNDSVQITQDGELTSNISENIAYNEDKYILLKQGVDTGINDLKMKSQGDHSNSEAFLHLFWPRRHSLFSSITGGSLLNNILEYDWQQKLVKDLFYDLADNTEDLPESVFTDKGAYGKVLYSVLLLSKKLCLTGWFEFITICIHSLGVLAEPLNCIIKSEDTIFYVLGIFYLVNIILLSLEFFAQLIVQGYFGSLEFIIDVVTIVVLILDLSIPKFNSKVNIVSSTNLLFYLIRLTRIFFIYSNNKSTMRSFQKQITEVVRIHLRKLFRVLDHDLDSKLTYQQFQLACSAIGISLTEEIKVDKNKTLERHLFSSNKNRGLNIFLSINFGIKSLIKKFIWESCEIFSNYSDFESNTSCTDTTSIQGENNIYEDSEQFSMYRDIKNYDSNTKKKFEDMKLIRYGDNHRNIPMLTPTGLYNDSTSTNFIDQYINEDSTTYKLASELREKFSHALITLGVYDPIQKRMDYDEFEAMIMAADINGYLGEVMVPPQLQLQNFQIKNRLKFPRRRFDEYILSTSIFVCLFIFLTLTFAAPENTIQTQNGKSKVAEMKVMGYRMILMILIYISTVLLNMFYLFNRNSKFVDHICDQTSILVRDMDALANLDFPRIDENQVYNRYSSKSLFNGRIPFEHEHLLNLWLLSQSMYRMREGILSFSKYLPLHVVRILMRKGKAATLGMFPKKVTILFSDIAGFTRLAENLEPKQLLLLLTDYFDEMTRIIDESKGTLLEIVGDAILAIWNSPVNIENHAAVAIEASLHMRRILNVKSKQWKFHNLPEIKIRCGIHTGDVLVGNVGGAHRMKYGVLGDGVNLASRIEALSKRYSTDILISNGVFTSSSLIKKRFIICPLDIVITQGKSRPTIVYNVVDTSFDALPEMYLKAKLHAKALSHYLKRDFRQSLTYIDKINELHPQNRDPTIRILQKKCIKFLNNPPSENWSGAEILTSKVF
ncbi:adenylate and guanylate cyclase catalytic domain-containing protein [Cryptosporidium andersoni]|uniref:Adenylate and guanylate cyclase catalytic domain-containing protein n=1 Tax=Cryptosporidium andersoni TaxID=117008 RepID=A0A1J4MVL0_9CRYT|nr:adenylate and guanylate cyclase catalytic domain-containing protein [Cryptosporidium andersoni]